MIGAVVALSGSIALVACANILGLDSVTYERDASLSGASRDTGSVDAAIDVNVCTIDASNAPPGASQFRTQNGATSRSRSTAAQSARWGRGGERENRGVADRARIDEGGRDLRRLTRCAVDDQRAIGGVNEDITNAGGPYKAVPGFSGSIDEVRLWNEPHDASDIVASTIKTYVIGVGPDAKNLDAIASGGGGGTGTAIMIATNDPSQITSDFNTALAKVQGDALS